MRERERAIVRNGSGGGECVRLTREVKREREIKRERSRECVNV
jgi:hypothetical protein